MPIELTKKQQNVLETITGSLKNSGYPPTLREISRALHSPVRTIRFHLKALARKKYIKLVPGISRGIELFGQAHAIPVIGKVSAGKPLEAIENIESYFNFDNYFPHRENSFILKVEGDSMDGEGIKEGDLLIVNKQDTANNGDIVVALIENEALVKKFYREKNGIRLEAANPKYPPLTTRTAQIVGKVSGVVRKM